MYCHRLWLYKQIIVNEFGSRTLWLFNICTTKCVGCTAYAITYYGCTTFGKQKLWLYIRYTTIELGCVQAMLTYIQSNVLNV